MLLPGLKPLVSLTTTSQLLPIHPLLRLVLEKSRTKDNEPGKKKQKTDAPNPKHQQKKTKEPSQSGSSKPAPKGKEKGKLKAKSMESVNEEGEE